MTGTSTLFSKLTKIYASTISFQDIDPYNKTSAVYLGGTLDAKIHQLIDSFEVGMSINHISNGGPIISAVLDKTSNDYYCGIAWGYHNAIKRTVWLFIYYNGEFYLRPMAEEI